MASSSSSAQQSRGDIVKHGFVYKCVTKALFGCYWQSRYLVLRRTADDHGVLEYYSAKPWGDSERRPSGHESSSPHSQPPPSNQLAPPAAGQDLLSVDQSSARARPLAHARNKSADQSELRRHSNTDQPLFPFKAQSLDSHDFMGGAESLSSMEVLNQISSLAAKPAKGIRLERYTRCEPLSTAGPRAGPSFTIYAADRVLVGHAKTYVFLAPSAAEANDWIAAIRHFLAKDLESAAD